MSVSHIRLHINARVSALGIESEGGIGGAAEVAGISVVVSLLDAHSAVSKQLLAG
jgi:hypothetical protein